MTSPGASLSAIRSRFGGDLLKFKFLVLPLNSPAMTYVVTECPVEAIFAEDDVPPDQQPFKALNAELSKLWKPIIERKPGPPDADEWKTVKAKLQMLER